MPEWVKSLLTAVGGGAVVLVGVFTVFKGLLVKLFETRIESSFEKNLEKYRNQLSRSTRAYEILLEKEFSCYEALDPQFATLLPLIQDLAYYADAHGEESRVVRYGEKFLEYCRIILKIKNDSILYQTYIPIEIFAALSRLVVEMQSDLDFWQEIGNNLFNNTGAAIDLEKANQNCEKILRIIAELECSIKMRLRELAES